MVTYIISCKFSNETPVKKQVYYQKKLIKMLQEHSGEASEMNGYLVSCVMKEDCLTLMYHIKHKKANKKCVQCMNDLLCNAVAKSRIDSYHVVERRSIKYLLSFCRRKSSCHKSSKSSCHKSKKC